MDNIKVRALEIVRVIGESFRAADDEGVQAMVYADALFGKDDENTLRYAVYSLLEDADIAQFSHYGARGVASWYVNYIDNTI